MLVSGAMAARDLRIRPLAAADGPRLSAAFARQGWAKRRSLFRRYVEESARGERVALVAELAGRPVGYVTLDWAPDYEPFAEAGIPEIVDLNVLLAHRGRGIGDALLAAAERRAFARAGAVGLGVGLTEDYGAAQRLYVRRGYQPDGRGLHWRGRGLRHGDTVRVDDSLVLYLVKERAVRGRPPRCATLQGTPARPEEPRMPELDLTDGPLFYELSGDGEPPLLLLHAGIADGRMWDELVPPLAARHRVARYDLRGFGRSPLPDSPFARHETAHELLEALDLAPAWLVGISFGARVALDLCLSHPEDVRGLVLVSPAVSGWDATGAVRAFAEREDELYEAGRIDEAVELNMRTWVDGPERDADAVDPTLRVRLAEMQRAAFLAPQPENVRSIPLDPPAHMRLEEIEVPTLVLSGALDLVECLALAETVVARIPDARQIVLPDAAHMACLDAPERFLELLETFVAEREGNATGG